MDGKKREKNARNAMEFLISVDLGKVWPPLASTAASDVGRVAATADATRNVA